LVLGDRQGDLNLVSFFVRVKLNKRKERAVKTVRGWLQVKVGGRFFSSGVLSFSHRFKRIKLIAVAINDSMLANVRFTEEGNVFCVLPFEGGGGIQFLLPIPNKPGPLGAISKTGKNRRSHKFAPWSCTFTIKPKGR